MTLGERGIASDSWQQRLFTHFEQAISCCAPQEERRDAAAHRQHILDVARLLFAAHGIDAVSMHQIAQAAGVGQGTLYRRFAHKGALSMALLVENVMRVQAELRHYLESCPSTTPAHEQLDRVLSLHVAFNEENGLLLSAVTEAACGERREDQFRNPLYLLMRETIETLLERAVALGERPPLDTAFTADAILASLAIDLYMHQRTTLGFTPERITDAVRHLYIEGLQAPAPNTRARDLAPVSPRSERANIFSL